MNSIVYGVTNSETRLRDFHLKKNHLFILAMLDLMCCVGFSLIVVLRLLIEEASLAVE